MSSGLPPLPLVVAWLDAILAALCLALGYAGDALIFSVLGFAMALVGEAFP